MKEALFILLKENRWISLFQYIKKLFCDYNLPISWIFQHDNDPKHKAAIVTKLLNDKKISFGLLSANSLAESN